MVATGRFTIRALVFQTAKNRTLVAT